MAQTCLEHNKEADEIFKKGKPSQSGKEILDLISANNQLIKAPVKWNDEDEKVFCNEYPYHNCPGCTRDKSPVSKRTTFSKSSKLPPLKAATYFPGPGVYE
jgi:hypothetical protein